MFKLTECRVYKLRGKGQKIITCPSLIQMAATNSRYWMFTWNNPPEDADPKSWPTRYLIYQLEKGVEGTPHFQGYCTFATAKRLTGVRKIAQVHWEMRKGSHEQAKAYCSKEDTRLSGPWEQGEDNHPGQSTGLLAVLEAAKKPGSLKSIIELDPVAYAHNYRAVNFIRSLYAPVRDWKMEVKVYWGTTGTGKSLAARTEMPNSFFKLSSCKWFDGYDGHEDVIFDDFTGGWFTMAALLQILDRGPCPVETKGGSTPFLARRVIITSNTHPKEWYPDHHQVPALLRRIDEIKDFTPLSSCSASYSGSSVPFVHLD